MRPALLPRVLPVDHAERLGITEAHVRTELRRGQWRRLVRGFVLTRPDEPTRADWAAVGIALAGPAAALSGWDVVRRYGLGPQEPPVPSVLVLTAAGHNRMAGHVRIRRTDRPLTTTRTGAWDDALPNLRLASPARAVADTALWCDRLDQVRAMVTGCVQRGFASPDELAVELGAGPQQGSALLRRAVTDLMDGARSVAEAEALDVLRDGGLWPFEVNAPIRDSSGRVVYVADFLWPTLRAIVEIDSREFHFSEDDWKRTVRRHNDLTYLGYAVAHYPPSAVRDSGAGWAADVRRWLEHRATELGVPAPFASPVR